jgi:cell division protein FtsL
VGVFSGLFILIIAGIVADTIVKLVKARSGSPQVRAELEDLRQQIREQAAGLADAHAALANQDAQIQELHERVDFAERIIAKGRDTPGLGAGQRPEA